MYFLTSSPHKFAEIKALLPQVEHLNIELPEIQEIDPQKIIAAKLEAAFQHHGGAFIVEDTSLSLEALYGLPGPQIKWFLKAAGAQGLAEIAQKLGNTKAEAKTIIGYAKSRTEISYFEGTIQGTIVMPRSESGFGWDPIFQPDGYEETFAQMTQEKKNQISHRYQALQKLKAFFDENPQA
jgi:inosine triphosphate pyrophosphatase